MSAIQKIREMVFAFGFRRAWTDTIKAHWPDVSREEISRWVDEYAGAPIGCAGYDWTPEAARDLARDYMREYGEAA